MAAPPAPRQLPLDLGHSPGHSRDDVVVTPANRDAVALIDAWPDWPGPAVALAGPAGAGKSHLAGIWRESAGAEPLPAAGLGPEAVEAALRGNVLVEDADAGALDETGLFHLMNAVRTGGNFLLLTARRRPAAWPVALPDLASRLKALTVAEIGTPDDALLAGVLAKLFADRQVEVDPPLLHYLVRRMERSLATAALLVERLDRVALERKVRISRQLAGEIIAEGGFGQAGLDP